MTELKRVCMMLAALGDPPITQSVLDAQTDSDAVEAQARLTEKSDYCQRSIPWAIHQATDLLTLGTRTLKWAPGDEIEQATSLATGVVLMIDNGYAWVRKDDDSPANFDGTHTITGQGDIAWTAVVSARTALPVDPPWSIDYLTPLMQEYITRDAALEWERYKKRGQVDDSYLAQQAQRARNDALRENQQIDGACFIDNADIFGTLGAIRSAELGPDGGDGDEETDGQ